MWFGIWPLLCFVGFVSVCRCSLLPVGCCGGWLPLVVFGRCSLLPVGCCGGWLPLVVSGCCVGIDSIDSGPPFPIPLTHRLAPLCSNFGSLLLRFINSPLQGQSQVTNNINSTERVPRFQVSAPVEPGRSGLLTFFLVSAIAGCQS